MRKPPPLPRSAKVAHLTVSIVPFSQHDNEDIDGDWNAALQRIRVAKELPHDQRAETLLHETLHACCSVAKIELDDEVEERFVNGVAPVLLQVLRDNPRFVRFLTKQMEEPE